MDNGHNQMITAARAATNVEEARTDFAPSQKASSPETLYWWIFLLLVAAAAAVVGLISSGAAVDGSIWYGVTMALIEFILIVLVAAAIKQSIDAAGHRRRRKEERIAEYTGLVESVAAVYSNVKRARRVLMASQMMGGVLPRDVYFEQVDRISSCQLSLDVMRQRIKIDPGLKDLETILAGMGGFLQEIVDQFKTTLSSEQHLPDHIVVPKESAIGQLLDEADDTFHSVFGWENRAALGAIRELTGRLSRALD